MNPVRTRLFLLGCIFVLVLSSGPVAKPIIKSWAVDDKGQARVKISQRQIFDEVGGKASLGLDVPAGLAVLASDLTLPEEVGNISGRGYVGMNAQSVSAVTDFTYQPLKSKQLELEVDYRAVEDTTHHGGTNRFSVGYPLSLEHVPAKVANYMARTSYDVVGRATWTHYTDAAGTLKVQIQDPDLSKRKSDVELLRIRVINSGTVVALHFQVVPNSPAAQVLQNRQAVEFGLAMALKAMGLTSQVRLGDVQMKGRSLEADVQVNLYNIRATVARWQAEGLKRFHRKGVDKRDVAGALSTLLDVQFPSADITIRSQGDHFDVDASLSASRVDKCILGYLRLKEVLEPSLIKERAHSEPLAVLVRNINAARTRRFRNVVAVVASSKDAGECTYAFKLRFPRGRMALSAEFKYRGNLEAYSFASEKMKIPVIHQAYSLLKIHTTPAGLQGHGLYEAQGAWSEGMWALCAEAARQDKELRAWFPDSGAPTLEEGRLLLELKKSQVVGTGWLKLSELAGYVRTLLTAGKASDLPEPTALDVRYDADKTPGKVLMDLYLKGASKDAVVKALSGSFVKDRKPEPAPDLAPPALTRPTVEMPAALAGEIENDRKALGVKPWVPAAAKTDALPEKTSPLRTFLIAAGLLLVAGGAAIPFLRRKGTGGPSGVIVVPSTQRFVQAPVVPELGSSLSPLRIRVVAGSAAGQIIQLPEHDVELGRDDGTGVRGKRLNIAEPTISRVQARLTYDPVTRKFTIHHAAAATNPTFVGESPVTSHLLAPGDTIQVGRMILQFEAETSQHR